MRISDWSSDVCSSDLKTCALTDAGIGNGHVARLGAANHDIYFGDRNVERSWIAGIERASANTGVKLSSEVLRLFRSEEHTSEPPVTNAHLVCRLLLEKKNNTAHVFKTRYLSTTTAHTKHTTT